MELNEFITKALDSIVRGTMEAKELLKDKVDVCLHTAHEYKNYPSVAVQGFMGPEESPLIVVDFRVLVEVESNISVDGKAKITCLKIVQASVSGGSSNDKKTAHEVAFSIPLVWREDKGSRKVSGPSPDPAHSS